VRSLRRQTDALHAILPLVSPEDPPVLASPALPGSLHELQLVGGLDLLELLALV